MDEGERLKKKVQPPNPALWNEDMRGCGSSWNWSTTLTEHRDILVSPDWRVIMLDFPSVPAVADSRQRAALRPGILAKLETLSGRRAGHVDKDYLSRGEVDAVMKRRDPHRRALPRASETARRSAGALLKRQTANGKRQKRAHLSAPARTCRRTSACPHPSAARTLDLHFGA